MLWYTFVVQSPPPPVGGTVTTLVGRLQGGCKVHSQCNKSAGGLLHTPKRIPTFMVNPLLSLGNNVFVDSLYEPALEPSIRTLGSSRISSMAYQ